MLKSRETHSEEKEEFETLCHSDSKRTHKQVVQRCIDIDIGVCRYRYINIDITSPTKRLEMSQPIRKQE